jgi:phosphoribosylformylglycinamidine synthase
MHSWFEDFDPMLSQNTWVKSNYFTIDIAPEAILDIDDIAAYNKQEGLSLSPKKWNT